MGLKSGLLAFMATAAAVLGRSEDAQAQVKSRFQQEKDKITLNDGKIIHVGQKFLSDKFTMVAAEQIAGQYVFAYKAGKSQAIIIGNDPDNDLLIDQLSDITLSETDDKGIVHTTRVEYGKKRGSKEFGVTNAMSIVSRAPGTQTNPDSLAQDVMKKFQPNQ